MYNFYLFLPHPVSLSIRTLPANESACRAVKDKSFTCAFQLIRANKNIQKVSRSEEVRRSKQMTRIIKIIIKSHQIKYPKTDSFTPREKINKLAFFFVFLVRRSYIVYTVFRILYIVYRMRVQFICI